MRVLLIHNRYQQPGGEDVVFEAEESLLKANGHETIRYTEDNRRIDGADRLSVALATIWSVETKDRLRALMRETRPDVAHFHNTFPLISPSAYFACREAGVPVVQTLHNYRLLCPAATFFREGRVCEDCLDRTPPWPGTLHGCYRNSRSQTAVVGAMLTFHRWRKSWATDVDCYIALTEFSRGKFIQGGLPEKKIVVKPNFVAPDPGARETGGTYALFVGRLSEEKGVRTLLRSWRFLPDVPLKIVGDGPLGEETRASIDAEQLRNVECLGARNHDEVVAIVKGARFLIFPSEWYETFGRVAIEAFACGVPVLASRLGAMAEVVEDGATGLLFTPGDAEELAAKARWAAENSSAMRRMGQNARRIYEEKYTPESNYRMLSDVYRRAMEGDS
jgi:glycosyltransferase involved in cell wall biosynthesis